mmetsp:Transcript_81427/g.161640  ORF Transcript_81427/g.161640 Transcript_81427/m.161640 type:complete len:222 (-) Transcript_81427:1847-2512(-)
MLLFAAALGQRPAAVAIPATRSALPGVDPDAALQHRAPLLHAPSGVAMSASLCCWMLPGHMQPQRPATEALRLLLAVFSGVPLDGVVDLPCFAVDCREIVGQRLRRQHTFVFDQLLGSPRNAGRIWKREWRRRQAAGMATSLATHIRKRVRAAHRGRTAPAQEAMGLRLDVSSTMASQSSHPQSLASVAHVVQAVLMKSGASRHLRPTHAKQVPDMKVGVI